LSRTPGTLVRLTTLAVSAAAAAYFWGTALSGRTAGELLRGGPELTSASQPTIEPEFTSPPQTAPAGARPAAPVRRPALEPVPAALAEALARVGAAGGLRPAQSDPFRGLILTLGPPVPEETLGLSATGPSSTAAAGPAVTPFVLSPGVGGVGLAPAAATGGATSEGAPAAEAAAQGASEPGDAEAPAETPARPQGNVTPRPAPLGREPALPPPASPQPPPASPQTPPATPAPETAPPPVPTTESPAAPTTPSPPSTTTPPSTTPPGATPPTTTPPAAGTPGGVTPVPATLANPVPATPATPANPTPATPANPVPATPATQASPIPATPASA
jgi:hypothetical protein